MKSILYRPMHLAVMICWLTLAGCLGGASAPTSFYMLSSLSPSQGTTATASADAGIRIGLATVVVPEYLNRNEIVVNLDDTVYQLAEFDQWAEPLSDNLTRVLAENLTNLLHTETIRVFLSSDSSIQPDYRLEVDLMRLDGNLAEQVTLVVQWALLEAEEEELILMRRSQYQEQAMDNTYKALVLAKSQTIEKLSSDIAVAIKKAMASRK